MKSIWRANNLFYALLAVAMVSQAEAASRCSRPAGFIKVNVMANRNTLVAYPFSPFDAGIQSVLDSQLRGGTNNTTADKVFKFNALTMKYEEASKGINGRWLASFDPAIPSEMTFEQGSAIWILSRHGDQDVVFSGEVGLNSTSNVLHPGPNAVSYPYTTATKLDGTALGSLSETNTGAGILLDPETLRPATEMNIGQGYWFNNTSGVSVVWAEMRPYANPVNPFPSNDVPPQIVAVNVDRHGDVTVAATGIPKSTVDILYKDITPTGVVELTWGWKLADTVKVKNDGGLEWTDKGRNGMDAPERIFGRLYLIGQPEDLDGNGIPDAREFFTKTVPPSIPDGQMWTEPGIGNQVSPPGGDSGITNALSNTNGVSPVVGRRLGGRVFHVAKKSGRDTLNGLAPIVVGSDGPKKTIKGGLDAGTVGDQVAVYEGQYHEKLHIRGSSANVRIEGKVRLLPGGPLLVATNSRTGGTNNVVMVEE